MFKPYAFAGENKLTQLQRYSVPPFANASGYDKDATLKRVSEVRHQIALPKAKSFPAWQR